MYVFDSVYEIYDSYICFYNKFEGTHGDYGGKLAEGYFNMRIVFGLGGERTIRFSAKVLDDDSKNDSGGLVYKGLNVDTGKNFFEIVLPAGANAYATTNYGNGKSVLAWLDEAMKVGLRGAHEARLGGDDVMVMVIDVPLTSFSQLADGVKMFSECTITLDGFVKEK
jgi:hypothetical protein